MFSRHSGEEIMEQTRIEQGGTTSDGSKISQRGVNLAGSGGNQVKHLERDASSGGSQSTNRLEPPWEILDPPLDCFTILNPKR